MLAALAPPVRGELLLRAISKRHLGGSYYFAASPLSNTRCAGWYSLKWFQQRMKATMLAGFNGTAYMDVEIFSGRCSPGVDDVARDLNFGSTAELFAACGGILRRLLASLRRLLGRPFPLVVDGSAPELHCAVAHGLGFPRADGRRVYSHSYSGLWAQEQLKAIREVDPAGLLYAVSLAWDKSWHSKTQAVFPIYLVSNALPLDEYRKRSSWVLVGYYTGVPKHVLASLGSGRKTQARPRHVSHLARCVTCRVTRGVTCRVETCTGGPREAHSRSLPFLLVCRRVRRSIEQG